MAEMKRLSNNTNAVNPDLSLAFDTIVKKKMPYDALYAYYKGNHPLRYSTDRLRKAFDKIGVYFAQNWIAVIVDAVLDRISLKGFDLSSPTEIKTEKTENEKCLETFWEENNLSLMADDVHEAATVLGEGYVIAWKEADDEGEEITDVYYNDPRMCHVFYDAYRPTQKAFAAKMWIGLDNFPRMILYYKDRLEHYISNSKTQKGNTWISSSSSFVLDKEYNGDGIEDNEYGIIPVFHYRSGRVSGKREIGQSEISLQDAVNKLFADMMVGSEFYTFAQRIIISQTDPGDLKNGAGVNWWVPAGDGKGQAASVIEIGAKSLDNYLHALDHVAQTMAVISRTPKHYLMLSGGDPSGDALLAMEAPLNKKVKKRIEGYEVEWKRLIQFIMKLEGIEINLSDIIPVWEPITTSQPLAVAQTVKTEVDSGIPLKTSLRRTGWGQDEITQMEADKKEEKKESSSLAQEELNRMRAEDAMNNDPTDVASSKSNDKNAV